MQQGVLSYSQYCWAKISLSIAGPLVVSYLVSIRYTTPSGRTIAGFLYGVLGLLATLVLMYYGVRKRTYTKNQWSLQAWLSFHCYVGVLTLLIIPLHAGFTFHGNIHTLAFVLLAIVVVSGMVGAWLYLTIPRQFGQLGVELPYVGTRTVDTELNRLLQQMRALSRDKSNAFARKCQEEMERGLPTRPVGWRLVFSRTAAATPLATTANFWPLCKTFLKKNMRLFSASEISPREIGARTPPGVSCDWRIFSRPVFMCTSPSRLS